MPGGVVAAMALGAEGVQLGTRFVAVEENIAHMNYKRAIVEADDADTVITCRKLIPTRSLKSSFSKLDATMILSLSSQYLKAATLYVPVFGERYL